MISNYFPVVSADITGTSCLTSTPKSTCLVTVDGKKRMSFESRDLSKHVDTFDIMM